MPGITASTRQVFVVARRPGASKFYAPEFDSKKEKRILMHRPDTEPVRAGLLYIITPLEPGVVNLLKLSHFVAELKRASRRRDYIGHAQGFFARPLVPAPDASSRIVLDFNTLIIFVPIGLCKCTFSAPIGAIPH
jgi:hypothetical protein